MKQAYSFAFPPSIAKNCTNYPEYDADRPSGSGRQLVRETRFRKIAYGTQQHACSAMAGRQVFL
ncbi:hypothetical protein [Sphingorhabdus sp. EL138]|uniref:hypothetical protein n=1 Tax=Sphingorhabdus sp. EL138 TaxID=2073156 RepID=UPI000D690B4E|nr:hypothetical protein [Sphingorhabdus sp. EL138]